MCAIQILGTLKLARRKYPRCYIHPRRSYTCPRYTFVCMRYNTRGSRRFPSVCVCEGDFGWRRDTRGGKKFYKIYKRERVTRSCRCIGLHTMSPSIRGISPPLPRNIFATRLPEFFPRFIVRCTGKVSFYRLYNPRQEMRYS